MEEERERERERERGRGRGRGRERGKHFLFVYINILVFTGQLSGPHRTNFSPYQKMQWAWCGVSFLE